MQDNTSAVDDRLQAGLAQADDLDLEIAHDLFKRGYTTVPAEGGEMLPNEFSDERARQRRLAQALRALSQLPESRGAWSSGERTRLACWFRRLAETGFVRVDRRKSSRRRGRRRQHARRVRSPEILRRGHDVIIVMSDRRRGRISPITDRDSVSQSVRRRSTARNFRGETAEEQPAAGLSVAQKQILCSARFSPIDHGARGFQVLFGAAGDAILGDQREDFVADRGNVIDVNLSAHSAGAAHRSKMPEQAKTSDVGRGADEAALGQLRPDGIDLRHQFDGGLGKFCARETTFDPSGGDARA